VIEQVADLWAVPADFRVITTNGSIRKDGRAVLGRGCAREAAIVYPRLPRLLGKRLQASGNRVHFFSDLELGAGARLGLFTFPVKHQWMERADLALISRSTAEFARQLLASATYVMPRPGCGNGGLAWRDVAPIVAVLPDNVTVVHFAREDA
jgi:hypothetical protein